MPPSCECHGEGIYLRENTRIFCECSEGQRRKRAWIAAGEIVKAEAERDRRRRGRMVRGHDFKAEAGGDREPGWEG
jgi:hypothetical protein